VNLCDPAGRAADRRQDHRSAGPGRMAPTRWRAPR